MGSRLPAIELAKIGWLWFTNPSKKSSGVDIRISIGPEFDIGWVNSVAVSIFYGNNFIGEVTQEDTFVLSVEHDDTYDICLKNFGIQDMIVFKKFIQTIMPNAKKKLQSSSRESLAILQLTEKGHKLAVEINLSGGFETTVDEVQRTGRSIKIRIEISNKPHVEIWFERVRFSLEKDGENLALLTGTFNVEAADGESRGYTFEGTLYGDEELSGKAKLRGYDLTEYENTWFYHALLEFETEVNLDEAVVYTETETDIDEDE
ncbi:hypothetical protein V8C35DRAFT_331236 [Trichoderma chlorosporum]